MKPTILFFVSSYHDASSRFRVEAYTKYLLEDFDIRIVYTSERKKFIPKWLKSPYKKLLLFYFAILSWRYNAVFIHRAVSNYKNSFWFEKLVHYFNKNMIFDYDDAIFLHNNTKVSGIVSLSKTVICGNNYLKDYALQYNKNAYILPTAIDTTIFTQKNNQNDNIVIGWTGTSSNYQFFSTELIQQISKILNKYENTSFLFICDKRPDDKFTFNYDFLKWNEKSEVQDLAKIDIGLMPLADNEWTKGKCGFKLIQYGAIGIPSLGSNVGVNSNIINHGVSGYLIENDQWYDVLEQLIVDLELRQQMGFNARKIIENQFSIIATYPNLKKLIDNTINS